MREGGATFIYVWSCEMRRHKRRYTNKDNVTEHLPLTVHLKKAWYDATLIFWDGCYGFANANAVLGKTSHLMYSELSLRIGFGRYSRGRTVDAMRRKEGRAVSDWSRNGIAVTEVLRQ